MVDSFSARAHSRAHFAGKIVLVTGAASGIGRGVALAFAEAGSDLVLVDIDKDSLLETAAMVDGKGSRALIKVTDVSDWDQMKSMADEVLSEWGHVDILVNNAGVGVGGELKDIPLESVEWIMGINLMGEIYGTYLFLPQMIERGGGHIVNVSSLSGLLLLPLHIPYTTTKYGITGFSEALWAETRRHGIGVTLVCPGPVKTNVMEHTRGYSSTKRQRESEERWGLLLDKLGMEPDEAGRRIMEAVARDRFLLVLGFPAKLMYTIKRLFPGLWLKLNAAITNYLSKE